MVRRFERDDAGYIAWLAAHPDGYVLNTHIHATSDYVILHRARCRTVNRPLATDRSWTYAYSKTCSDAREDVEAWALAEAGGPAQPCGKCLASPGRRVAAESGHVPVAGSIAANAQGANTLGAIAISEVTELAGFSWRWPMGTEEFDHGWDYVASTDGDRYRVRHGIGGRVVYGQSRVHSVTWLDKSPMVEGVAPDDYGTSGALVSVIRIGGGPHVRSLGDLPLGYAGFEIVRQSDEIKAKYAHASLSVKILEDDLGGWARHAILRARSKDSPKRVAGSQQRIAPPAAPLSEPPDLDRQAITRVCLTTVERRWRTRQVRGRPSSRPTPRPTDWYAKTRSRSCLP